MLKCLMKYEWVKLRRDTLPIGKGIMGAWAKLAARAAFRKGHASYCGHKNAVSPGMWSGGIVGLKSILGIKSRVQALEILDKLSDLGYLKYTLDSKTKKLTYQLTDWVVKCSGEECMNGTVYATAAGFPTPPPTGARPLPRRASPHRRPSGKTPHPWPLPDRAHGLCRPAL